MATVDLDNSERSLMQALIRKSLMGQRNDSTRFRLNAINAKLVAPVAPDPGLREAIAELRRDITRFANHKMQYGMSFERGDTENAEENHLLAEQLSEKIDAVLSVLAERGVR